MDSTQYASQHEGMFNIQVFYVHLKHYYNTSYHHLIYDTFIDYLEDGIRMFEEEEIYELCAQLMKCIEIERELKSP